MDEALRSRITEHLDGTVDIVLDRVREKARLFFNSELVSSGNGTASPFSKILFPQIKLASLVERSFSASIGTTFNYIARDLVRFAYGNGEIEKVVEGELPISVIAKVDQIVDRYRGAGHRSPDTINELIELASTIADSPVGEPTEVRRLKSDVYFVDLDGVENFIEIKTPMPNYDTCKAVKNRILLVHALRDPKAVNARVAFPYNPNGILGTYAWPPARYFLDPAVDWYADRRPLMGAGLWNYLGNSDDTFSELLGCCEDVFTRRGTQVADVLTAVTFGTEEI